MGDVIHALPVASAIHEAWPETRITWLVDPRWQPLLESNPAITRTHIFPRQEFRGIAGGIRGLRWFMDLGGLQPELTLDLQGLLRSGMMAAMARGAQTVGLSDAREGAGFFYSRVASVARDQHAVDRYLACLPAIGIEIPEEKEFPISLKSSEIVSSIDGAYIVLHPFARGEDKAMSGAAIHEFIRVFAAHSPLKIVLAGFGSVEGGFGGQVIDLVGRTSLGDLTALLAGARFVVSVDSGPMHLAAALKTPLLGIHTWSDPRRVGPYSTEAWIWQGGEIRRQDLGSPPLREAVFGTEDAAVVARFVAEQVGNK